MTRSLAIDRHVALPLPLSVPLMQPPSGRAAIGDAEGRLTHEPRTVTFKHAYLVTGPGGFDPKKAVRRVIPSAKHIRARIRGGRP